MYYNWVYKTVWNAHIPDAMVTETIQYMETYFYI